MQTSENTNEIATALAAAQAELQNPSFDSTNPHFKSKFASLAAVRNAVIPTMTKHGISVFQDVTTTERGVSCVTRLSHKSGQYIQSGELIMPLSKHDAQGVGSGATYARRYQLMAVAGVVGDDDTDATDISGKNAETITKEQAEKIRKELAETSSSEPRFLEFLGVSALEKLPAAKYQQALTAISLKKLNGANHATGQ